jgi:hypothetical protein
MGQVFGEIDERKTAAEQLQRLRQVRSVTEYITEFRFCLLANACLMDELKYRQRTHAQQKHCKQNLDGWER